MAIKPFRIRTITAFVTLHPSDFAGSPTVSLSLKIDHCSTLLREAEARLSKDGFEVQTVRIATNPFGEWLTVQNDGTTDGDPARKRAKLSGANDKQDEENEADEATISERLQTLNELLFKHDIGFCSLGPSMNPRHTTSICPKIVSISPGRFSCSANVNACDVECARATANCVQIISSLGIQGESHLAGGLGNFRFCAVSCVESGVPFFPAARGASAPDVAAAGGDGSTPIRFGIGLENGGFALDLLKEAKSISAINNVFSTRMRKELLPIQELCLKVAEDFGKNDVKIPIQYLGIDTSFNPSLDEGGSVAAAIEALEEVRGNFGQCGSLSAAAAITTSLQSIPDIIKTGYCGLMLPVLEDKRLAQLGMTNNDDDEKQSASAGLLTIQKLLYISAVCGVGIDTVPIPGDVSEGDLSSLILDVAALAGRWKKPLSCRVFPVPGGKAGEETTFDSPYMCNSCIFSVE